MITDEMFRDAVLRYKTQESRGSFYDIAVNLLDRGFRMEAYLLLLATWNFASFQYAVTKFDLVAFEDTVKSLETNFQRLDGKDFRTADFDSLRGDISVIYDTLSQIKGIQYTGAPKMMHLRNRNLFVMWDAYVRGLKPRKSYERLEIVKSGDWEVKEYGSGADDYLHYLKDMQHKYVGISFAGEGKTLAKAIDEFNYVNITLPMQTMEKAVPPKSREANAVPSAERVAGMVNIETFRQALRRVFSESKGSYVDVTSGDLYAKAGGRTDQGHNRMPSCCDAMTGAMQPGDKVLASPPKGRGSTLTVRYILPR